jgi:ATP-dependent protease ClpP protease subunit|tara:strand:- start:4954 stop:6183 length:1230 start_codon:yes stop_codon:yes gene_type:complete
MNKFLNLASNADGSTLNISINDDIGDFFGTNSEDVARTLKNNPNVDTINVDINSFGGSLFDGISIFNQLQESSATVNTSVSGVAASAASLIFMAGDNRTMNIGSFLMIHKPSAFSMANADEMRKTADNLDQFQNSIVDIYDAKADATREEINEMVNAETWLSGSDAVDMGFATQQSETPAQVENKFDYAQYLNSYSSKIPKEAEKHFKNYKTNKIQQVLNKLKNVVLNINPNEDDMNKEEVEKLLADNNSKLETQYSNQLNKVRDDFTNKLAEKDGVINSLQETVNAQSTKIEDLKNKAATSTIENIVDGFINQNKIAPKDREIEIENLKLREGADTFETYKNSIANREPVVDMTQDYADEGPTNSGGKTISEIVNQLIEDSGKTMATATSAEIKAASAKARKKIAGGN